MPRWMEAIHEEQEYGMTMPVVPRMESPPTMPRRALVVFLASSSPPGMATVISTSPPAPNASATSAIAPRIMLRGTGLIAGSPTGMARPARVTVPTPSPARKLTPAPGGPKVTATRTSARWVTSGSSPASLTIPAVARPSASSATANGKLGRSPRGRVMVTGSGKRPVSNASYAAWVAAVAHAPVLQPLLSVPVGLRVMGRV